MLCVVYHIISPIHNNNKFMHKCIVEFELGSIAAGKDWILGHWFIYLELNIKWRLANYFKKIVKTYCRYIYIIYKANNAIIPKEILLFLFHKGQHWKYMNIWVNCVLVSPLIAMTTAQRRHNFKELWSQYLN